MTDTKPATAEATPATFTAADVSHALRCSVRAWGDEGHWGPCVDCLDLWQRARAAGEEDCAPLAWEGPGADPVAALLALSPEEQRPHLHARRAAFQATL